jgi:aspartate-semialdehyde dehydrogenase
MKESANPTPSKIPVAILGATGAVGQRFVALLADHPWFEVARLFASERSAGKTYSEAVSWVLDSPIPPALENHLLESLDLGALDGIELVFSALGSEVAGPIETSLADAGLLVFSNASSHRMAKDVPLVIPEVNPDHLALASCQPRRSGGAIITNPNCSTIGLVLSLAPLHNAFGIRRVSLVTNQALSGAGLADGALLKLHDNVIPFIRGEEEKLAQETNKLLGELLLESAEDGTLDFQIEHATFPVSATCIRVPVSDGHLLSVSVELDEPATHAEVTAARVPGLTARSPASNSASKSTPRARRRGRSAASETPRPRGGDGRQRGPSSPR